MSDTSPYPMDETPRRRRAPRVLMAGRGGAGLAGAKWLAGTAEPMTRATSGDGLAAARNRDGVRPGVPDRM